MSANFLTRHLDSVDETYFEHFSHALHFATSLAIAAVACFVHALLPFLFERTGSLLIDRLHQRMVVNRRRKSPRNDKIPGSAGAPFA
ncbi:MAG TPA: DUF6356 family protein [Gammaproteobacteria bacterium]|nr:DUF6356 family protein [Gammaproteobacteria bacterium]